MGDGTLCPFHEYPYSGRMHTAILDLYGSEFRGYCYLPFFFLHDFCTHSSTDPEPVSKGESVVSARDHPVAC